MTLTTERQQFEQWWETTMHNGYPPRFSWEHWRDGDGYRDDDGEFQGLWQAWQASRGFLANREEQPVGYIDPDSLKEYRGQRAGGTWSAVQRTTSGLNMTTPIYTTPPAPAVPEGGNDHDTRR